MGLEEQSTFFLYSVGHSTELLTLGTLIWQDYANPEIARHWSFPRISDDQLENYAYVKPLKQCVLSDGRRREYGVGLEIFTGAGFDLSLVDIKTKCVTAASGRRVVLKDPAEFVNAQLEEYPTGTVKIQQWLTAARNAYYLHAKWLRRPKIWVLTGYYELQQTQAYYSSHKEPGGRLKIDANTMGLATSVPIGGSVSMKDGRILQAGSSTDETGIWAARFQMLDVKYVRLDPRQGPMPGAVNLLSSFSKGALRGGGGGGGGGGVGSMESKPDYPNAVEGVKLSEAVPGEENDTEEDDEDEKLLKKLFPDLDTAFDIALHDIERAQDIEARHNHEESEEDEDYDIDDDDEW